MAKGPFTMPGQDAPVKDWKDVAMDEAAPDQRTPSADDVRRGCVKGREGY